MLKKTSETTPTMGSIVDTYSTSEQDGYACDYINDLHTYSTTEQRVGTWIDGKPLYRKYLKISGLPENTTKVVDTGISNLDFIKIDYGKSYCTWQTPKIYPILRSSLTVEIDDSKKIAITSTTTYGSGWWMYVMLEYTKTTD